MSNKPKVGTFVEYTLNHADANLIASRRMAQPDAAKGNPVEAGHTYPALIVAIAPDPDDTEADTEQATAPGIEQTRYAFEKHPSNTDHVNLQVFLDGYDQHWVTDIPPASDKDDADNHGTYR